MKAVLVRKIGRVTQIVKVPKASHWQGRRDLARPAGISTVSIRPSGLPSFLALNAAAREQHLRFALCVGSIFPLLGVAFIKLRDTANKKHCTRVFETTSQRQPTISAICTTQSQLKLAEEVCRAELCFARFVVEHNLPFAVADHFNKLAASMFPDSKIAQEFACARTKTAALVTHALAPAANEPVVEALRRQCFTVLCDGE